MSSSGQISGRSGDRFGDGDGDRHDQPHARDGIGDAADCGRAGADPHHHGIAGRDLGRGMVGDGGGERGQPGVHVVGDGAAGVGEPEQRLGADFGDADGWRHVAGDAEGDRHQLARGLGYNDLRADASRASGEMGLQQTLYNPRSGGKLAWQEE